MANIFIIAEAGVNHNGSVDTAIKLIDAAKDAGVDAVKFQTFKADKLVSPLAPKAEYQKLTTSLNESQFEMIKRLELSNEEFIKIFGYCSEKGIRVLSTPFDIDSARFLKGIGQDLWKLPSGEITNLPLIRELGSYKSETIVSTGMANLDEVRACLHALTKCGLSTDNISILHCVTEYPAPIKEVNLMAMRTLSEELHVSVGLSDHTLGIEIPIAAAALGATIIEKHFTLNKASPGPDHHASINPCELKAMVTAIRNVEKAMGKGKKQPTESELKNIVVARKSVVATRDIRKGERFTHSNLTTKRPGNGISPMQWDRCIGATAHRNFMQNEQIEL